MLAHGSRIIARFYRWQILSRKIIAFYTPAAILFRRPPWLAYNAQSDQPVDVSYSSIFPPPLPNRGIRALPHKRPQRGTLSMSKGLPQVGHATKNLLLMRKDQDDSFGQGRASGIWRLMLPGGCRGITTGRYIESVNPCFESVNHNPDSRP